MTIDLARCKKNLQKRIQRKVQANEQIRLRVFQETLPRLVAWFQKNPVVEKAYLFGSILEKGNFTSESDLDLGVAGLDEKKYFEVWAQLEEIARMPIDFRTLDQNTHFAESVKKNGRVIYERR